MKRLLVATLVMMIAVAVASSAYAGPILPTFTTFGTLAGATFGGTGIPNDKVAIATFNGLNGDVITLGLTAFGRYSNPALGDNGAGTFFATPGVNDGLGGQPLGTTWDFGFYVDVKTSAGLAGNIADYKFDLLYDFDPGTGTDASALGHINLTNFAVSYGLALPLQDSENLYFASLATPVTGYVATPTFSPFDGNATGEYTIALRALTSSGAHLLGQAAIDVDVVPDGGATLTLLGCALVGLGALRRKFRG